MGTKYSQHINSQYLENNYTCCISLVDLVLGLLQERCVKHRPWPLGVLQCVCVFVYFVYMCVFVLVYMCVFVYCVCVCVLIGGF